MKLKSIFLMLLATAISVAGFQACKQQPDPKPEGLQMSSSPQGNSLLGTCLVRYENEMLVFSSWECFNNVADSLLRANDNYYQQNPNDSSEYKAYELFENFYPNYISKRKEIVNLEEQMLEDQTWTAENDPDDFPPHTDEYRTLINDKGLVQVQDTIYVFRKDGNVFRVFRTSLHNNLT